MLTTVLAFLVTIGVLVIIHEYGHYRAAVACGVSGGREVVARVRRRGANAQQHHWLLADGLEPVERAARQ